MGGLGAFCAEGLVVILLGGVRIISEMLFIVCRNEFHDQAV